MLQLLRAHKAQGVLIHKIDRSARNLKDWADLGELIDQGIEVHFANESLDLNSRSGRLSADIQAVVAADYIRNLREEAKKGIYGRLKQGFYPLMAPIGYKNNGAGKAKTIDPERGPLIRKAFELYRTAKFNIDTLVEEMYRLGLRNRNGRKVTRNGFSVMLKNPFYIGLMRIQKTGQVFEGNHEPLISKQLFDDVQAIREGRFSAAVIKNDFLFRKTVACALCGYSLIGERQKGHVYYRCHRTECPATGIREEAIQMAVQEALERLTFTQDEQNYLRSRIAVLKANWITEKEKQMTALSVQSVKITERLNRLTDLFLDGSLDRALFEEKKQALFGERRGITVALESVHNNRAIPEELERFVELAGNALLLYESALPDKKRRIVQTVSSNLIVREKTVDFAMRKPFAEIANRQVCLSGGPCKDLARTLDALLIEITTHLAQNTCFMELQAA